MLLDKCMTARYFNYKMNTKTAEESLELLKNIKKEIGLPSSISELDLDTI
jgi:predicted double-glycine peptidase